MFAQGLDALCVQSLDGQLSFYEGESSTFQRFLPNFLLPGPITYIPETDCIVTANSSMTIESYKFSVGGQATLLVTPRPFSSRTIPAPRRPGLLLLRPQQSRA